MSLYLLSKDFQVPSIMNIYTWKLQNPKTWSHALCAAKSKKSNSTILSIPSALSLLEICCGVSQRHIHKHRSMASYKCEEQRESVLTWTQLLVGKLILSQVKDILTYNFSFQIEIFLEIQDFLFLSLYFCKWVNCNEGIHCHDKKMHCYFW